MSPLKRLCSVCSTVMYNQRDRTRGAHYICAHPSKLTEADLRAALPWFVPELALPKRMHVGSE